MRFGVIENLARNKKLLQLLTPTRNGFPVAISQKDKAKDLESLTLTRSALKEFILICSSRPDDSKKFKKNSSRFKSKKR